MATLPRLTPRYHEVEGIRNLERIDPLHPPWSNRRSVSLETTDAHELLDQRVQALKQREHHRFHTTYQTPIYGSIAGKELYRSDIRTILKQQMDDRIKTEKRQFMAKLTESKEFIENDRKVIQDDIESRRNKIAFLMKFRDENKRLAMEATQRRQKEILERKQEEKELLKFNPFNWSHSMR